MSADGRDLAIQGQGAQDAPQPRAVMTGASNLNMQEEPDWDVVASMQADGLTYDLVVMRGSGQPVKDGTMQTMIVAPQVRITKAEDDGATEGQAS